VIKPGQTLKHQEELVSTISSKLTEIVEIAVSDRQARLEEKVRLLFEAIRAGKKLNLLPSNVEVSSKSMRPFLKETRALGKIKTAGELRSLIVHDLRVRNIPEGICVLLELGGNDPVQ